MNINEHAEIMNAASFLKVEVIEDGRALAVVLKERDGTISAIRIAVEQLAD